MGSPAHLQVSVATITWARDDAEEQRLRAALSVLAASELQIAIADTGTNPAFTSFLNSCPTFKVMVPGQPSLMAQVQASLQSAATWGSDFILYTEPDKEEFFKSSMARFIEYGARNADVGVVLAARSDTSFATFPPLQRFTEGTINYLTGRSTRTPGDYSYGPMLVNPSLVPYISSLEPEIGWGWRHFLAASAVRLGFRVVHVVDDYPCPPDQQNEDDHEELHRMRQLSQNIMGLVRGKAVQGRTAKERA
jgi:hypothetical protein